MTLHRDRKVQYLECEDCPETFGEDEEMQFRALIDGAKEAGWKIEPVGSSWEHRCKSCASESKLDKQMRLFR